LLLEYNASKDDLKNAQEADLQVQVDLEKYSQMIEELEQKIQ
jgi:hypothetical protein